MPQLQKALSGIAMRN